MRYLFLLISLLCTTLWAAPQKWSTQLELSTGDRVAFIDSVSGATVIYTIPAAGYLTLDDGDHPLQSILHYHTEVANGAKTHMFYGLFTTASPTEIALAKDHQILGTDGNGTALAGAAALTMSAGASGAIALAEIGTVIGTVVVEFVPHIAIATGLAITATYIHRGVTDWLSDVRRHAWQGIDAFAQYVTRQWAALAAGAVGFEITSQLLAEIEDLTDEEVVEILDATWVTDDMERLMEYMSDPDPEDNWRQMLTRVIEGGLTIEGSRQLAMWAMELPDQLAEAVEELRRRSERKRRSLIVICEDDDTELYMMKRIFRFPFFDSDHYRWVVAKNVPAAATILKDSADQIALVILDGKMPGGGDVDWPTRELVAQVPTDAILLGNSDNREVRQLMQGGNLAHAFYFVCQKKTEDLAPLKFNWQAILPKLE